MATTDWTREGFAPCEACGKLHGSVGGELRCLRKALRRARDELSDTQRAHAEPLAKLARIEAAVAAVHALPSWRLAK